MITLYVPCHNAERYLERCLKALLGQTLKPDEIIVVNDGSTDRTAQIAQRHPVKLLTLDTHPGLAAARNAAIQAARYDYVASVDVDCIADPDWLEQLLQALVSSNAAGAGGRLVETYRTKAADRWRSVHMRQDWGELKIVNPPFLFGCNSLFNKKALLAVNCYNSSFKTNGEDVDLSHRLKAEGYTLVYEPAATVRHLKQDTILSVLKADWNWGYKSTGETMKYGTLTNILYFNFLNAKHRMKKDISAKRYALIPIDAFLMPVHSLLDLRFADKLRSGGKRRNAAADTTSLDAFKRHIAGLAKKYFGQEPDAFAKRASDSTGTKILFALFGAMGDVFNGLPVVHALRSKYPCAEITWITLPCYKEIAECAPVDRVITYGTGRHGNGIPAELLERERFDLVLFPQGSVNHDEWERSGLHMIDFMAKKCDVSLTGRSPVVRIDDGTKEKADALLQKFNIGGQPLIAVASSALSCRSWPIEKFRALVRELNINRGFGVIHIGGKNDAPIEGTIDCRSLPVLSGIALIKKCNLYIGCDSGPTWMAACTDTPIVALMDPERQKHFNVGFKRVMPEKDITELSMESETGDVVRCIDKLIKTSPASPNKRDPAQKTPY